MMIELVMYGMIPSANTAKLVSAPPEKSWSQPSTPPDCDAWSRSCSTASTSIPGAGTYDPNR